MFWLDLVEPATNRVAAWFGNLGHLDLSSMQYSLVSSFSWRVLSRRLSESALFYGQRAVCWCCGSWVHLRSPWAVQVCEWVDGPRSRRPAPSTTTVGANRFPNLAMGIHGGFACCEESANCCCFLPQSRHLEQPDLVGRWLPDGGEGSEHGLWLASATARIWKILPGLPIDAKLKMLAAS